MLTQIAAIFVALKVFSRIEPYLHDQAELVRIMHELDEEEARRRSVPPSRAWPVIRELLLALTIIAVYVLGRVYA